MKYLMVVTGLVLAISCLTIGCSNVDHPAERPVASTNVDIPDEATIEETEYDGIDTYLGRVSLSSVQIDKVNKTVTSEITMYWDGDKPQSYIFSIAGITTSMRMNGFRVSLSSMQQTLLWEYVFEIDPQARVGYVTERSADDYLTLVLREGTEERGEAYIDSKGTTHEYRYPVSISRKLRSSSFLTPADQSELDTLSQDFRSWYNMKGSLNDNRYGFLVTELCTRNDFLDLLYQQYAGVSPAQKFDPYNNQSDFCLLAATCATLKCLEGFVANPICAGCFGVSVGCLIGDWYDALFGD
jgi:hypothetical protein